MQFQFTKKESKNLIKSYEVISPLPIVSKVLKKDRFWFSV